VGGDANISQWLKDEGCNAPIGSLLKVSQTSFSEHYSHYCALRHRFKPAARCLFLA
jgi:hypothetical protein